MKYLSLRAPAALAGAALVTGLAGMAFAQDTPEAPPLGIAGGHGQAALIASYDVDGDGQVTRAEFDQVRQERFQSVDEGAKGWLTEAEYVAEFELRLKQQYFDQGREPDEFYTRGIEQAHVRFAVLDRDRNGELSLEEYNNSGEQTFTRSDTNGDGVVNADDPAPQRDDNDDDADGDGDN